jgi:hypothetical protein
LSLTLIAIAAWGCGASDESEPGRAVGEPTVVVDGTKTTVVNTSEPLWARGGELVEEASIGAETGDEAYLLGSVTSIAAGDERIYLVDSQAVRVRVYDLNGTHVLDIGAQGGGPGEFQRPVDVGYGGGGRIVVRDEAQNRVHVFAPDGELTEDWPTEAALRATIGADGSVFLIREDIVPDENGEVSVRLMRYDPQGQADDWDDFPNRPPPPMLDNSGMQPRHMMQAQAGFQAIGVDWRTTAWVPFGPRVIAELAPDGARVSGRGDAYSFEVYRDDGSVMVVEKEWDPVPITVDEAAWYRRRLTALWRSATDQSWVWPGPEIPAHKGAFKYIIPTADGRFWVVRQMAGLPREGCDPEPDEYYGYEEDPCWLEPLVADVFDEEGRFLGPVPMPDGIRYLVRPYIRDDTVIALLEDAEGISFIKRFRLHIPG